MVVIRALLCASALLAAAACAPRPTAAATTTAADVAAVPLEAPGGPTTLGAELGAAPITVVTFFSAHCPCQRAHDPVLRALYTRYAGRGVRFVAVDSERGASLARAAAEAEARGYPFPLLADPEGRAREALGARYATYTVVFAGGRVRYAGGVDSARTHEDEATIAFLDEALADLVAGRDPRRAEGKVLGCALER